MLYLTKTRFYWLLKAVMNKLSICFLLINLRAITKINMRSEKRCSFVKGSKNEYKNYMYILLAYDEKKTTINYWLSSKKNKGLGKVRIYFYHRWT